MKGLGQKYMGGRPESHAQAMFSESSVHTDKDHIVPISNFMNAQCMYYPSFQYLE
jgi:saccharopepsin